MKQLTQQIAGAYMNAHIEWNGNTTAKVIDVIDTRYLNKCRLILTPLSHITDEDAIEVANIGKCRYSMEESKITAGKELIIEYVDRQSNVVGRDWQQIIDHLRSRNYDIGYGSDRSGIDAGWAISSLTN